ncbi:trehalose-phosphatase [Geothrix fuzhouensis]|uniref:trehalose-phosphatase n=1 Tax=Geothrix fuzhouensis TaxID=2966451 RepID=UPI0021492BAE|nr:trehalose-phosphatase [Geothrix fuzhouensis]
MRRAFPPVARVDWAFFLDVDGTLIDIADQPDAIRVDTSLLDLITQLHRASGGAVALVTGRSLSDLEHHLGPLRMPLAGQQGLERRDAAGRLWIHAAPPAAKVSIKEALASVLARHPGLLLEDKGLTLALHYRQAPQLAAYVHRLMGRLAPQAGPDLELQRGKRVVEIKPAGFDKGTAVAEYLSEPPFKGRRPVFIGDDLNDEHGFTEVNRLDGISIKVGKGPSCARFYLPDVAAVHHWLGEAVKGIP